MKNKLTKLVFTICLLLVFQTAQADAVGDANRLLRVTELGRLFETIAQRQTRDIIRTYSSIVATSVELTLPLQVKQNIAACYDEVYAWENFEPGIAQILADNLSQKELRLLIDFYRSLGLPPMEIQTFKDTIAKADRIRQISAQYILDNSGSCVDRDADLILGYIASQRLADGPAPAAE